MFQSLLARWRAGPPYAASRVMAICSAAAAIGMLGALSEAHAAGLGLRPGLWNVRLVRQIVDGHDVSAQLSESVAKGQTALAKLPPDARARAQASLHPSRDPGSNTRFRVCLSAAMAARDLPILDRDGSCRPALVSRSSHGTTFTIQCSVNGTQVQGRGEAVNAGDLVTSRSDVVTRAADGSTHRLHNETQMQYLGADCGKLAPAQ